ncbi:thiocillin family RiPP [Synechococcus sp. UW179A]|uniref:thiocillin family RiPP n=1 Tax=Synechococcus sp. UW179A TaxID=2575510 RepID=UPI001A7E1045|nr:thiocillin family RiPP [Synechococcus sp. UW179A]
MKSDLSCVLDENGFDTEGRKFETYETELHERHVVHLPLPRKPPLANFNEEQLAAIAGGGSCSGSAGTAGSASCPAGSASTTGSAGSHCTKPKKH